MDPIAKMIKKRFLLSPVMTKSASKVGYVSFSHVCEARGEHAFVHETTVDLALVGLVVVAPEGSVVLSINDGVKEILSEPLPASVFFALEYGSVKGSFVKPVVKQVVTVRCGEVPGRVAVGFVVSFCPATEKR